MTRKYKCLLFDFDRTIWDVESNQKEALRVIHKRFKQKDICYDFEEYYTTYTEINDRLWLEYRNGFISREYLRNHRFAELLNSFCVTDSALTQRLSDEYISLAPSFNKTIPHSKEVVIKLHESYPLHLITNGFNEVQQLKVHNCGLDGYFDHIITSEDAGANKPNKLIFDYALNKIGVSADQTIVIGDDIDNDIKGAIGAEIDTVFFNPHQIKHNVKTTYEIESMLELLAILA